MKEVIKKAYEAGRRDERVNKAMPEDHAKAEKIKSLLLSEFGSFNKAFPRQIAMFIMRERTRLTLSTIGLYFGKSHSTVIYGVNKVGNYYEIYPDVRDLVDKIEAQL